MTSILFPSSNPIIVGKNPSNNTVIIQLDATDFSFKHKYEVTGVEISSIVLNKEVVSEEDEEDGDVKSFMAFSDENNNYIYVSVIV
jgi:hypothetical protein